MQNTFETLALTALWNGVVETTTNENSLLTADKLLRENKSKIEAFWHIGRFIVMNEQGGKVTARYGEETIVSVSKYLTWKYGRGFSARNIAYIGGKTNSLYKEKRKKCKKCTTGAAFRGKRVKWETKQSV